MPLKKMLFYVIAAASLLTPSPGKAYYATDLQFGPYGPCRQDSYGCGYEFCRRCPHLAPCCGIFVIGAVVAVALIVKKRGHHGHGHGHSDST